MERAVRVGVVVVVLAVLGIGALALRDGLGLVGRPWPGFGALPNGEVGPPLLTTTRFAREPGAPSFQDRVLRVNGEPATGAGALRRRLEAAGAGALVRYAIERPDGRVEERTLPVPAFGRGDLARIFLPLFVGGAFGLLLGAVPVLARPTLPAARLFFLMNVGLTVNFGFLTLTGSCCTAFRRGASRAASSPRDASCTSRCCCPSRFRSCGASPAPSP